MATITLGQIRMHQDVLRLACGIVVSFYGARYMSTIAAVEAFRLVGWKHMQRSLVTLWDNGRKAAEASRKDDKVDADKDGVPDVQGLSRDELVKRKLPVIIKAVDPEEVSEALSSVSAGLTAVIATLKVQFAKTLALGATIGDVVADFAGGVGEKVITAHTPPEYQKWVPLVVQNFARLAGCTAAFTMQRFTVGMHTALRGSQLMAEGSLAAAVRLGVLNPETASSAALRSGLHTAMAAAGLYWQVSSGFGSLPFPLNILLWPVDLLESLLTIIVSLA
mmetsp:Transcript_16568/g.44648  ORF Transcript_16568/g.44648 Transcript_16568/m.44648 type:complete len:278 (-) Transcript_16568:287-1120(-)|eukprot:CAMPEP_0185185916 /NCGR_PEP_ID=MMETSP1140-20130426/3659_1 /TAXON_ID=298111 /ORGANISM="Pavlova sp., Strain CCMP459" /LENGTH=277 /DNA_ID=CAMNT_0027752153 /DNA_START=13 /DNA_END=846 /DNA_ORIENTATION=-